MIEQTCHPCCSSCFAATCLINCPSSQRIEASQPHPRRTQVDKDDVEGRQPSYSPFPVVSTRWAGGNSSFIPVDFPAIGRSTSSLDVFHRSPSLAVWAKPPKITILAFVRQFRFQASGHRVCDKHGVLNLMTRVATVWNMFNQTVKKFCRHHMRG